MVLHQPALVQAPPMPLPLAPGFAPASSLSPIISHMKSLFQLASMERRGLQL